MRRVLGAMVALAAIAMLGLIPSGAGQHFGIMEGDVGSWGGLSAGPATKEAKSAGWFGVGPSVDFRSGGATVADPGVATITGCVTMTLPGLGEDRGCVHNLVVPTPAPDPRFETLYVHVSVPSEIFQGQRIDVSLQFRGEGEIMPEFTPEAQPTNLPSFGFLLRAGVRRPAAVAGKLQSEGLRAGMQIGPGEPAEMSRGVHVVACDPC